MNTGTDNEGSPPMNDADTPKASRREWVGLAILALPCLLYSMDLTVLNLAVPHLSTDLKPSNSQLLWIVDIYGFLVAGSLVTMGTLGDRIGRRRLLLIGAVAFGAASVLAAFSFSAGMLIVARALLGIAAATLAPSTLSLIRNMFLNPRERTFAVGVWIASFSAGGAIGPLIGGLLLEYFWWGSVFLVSLPVMLLLLAVGPMLLPEFRDPHAGRMDLSSAALSLAAVLPVIYGIKKIAERGGLALIPALTIAAGFAIGVAFLRRQRRLADPLIDLSLFRSPAFGASLAVNIIGFFIAFGTFLFIAQYLQLVLGMSPFKAGLWTAPSGVAFVAGSMLAPVFAGRMRPAYVIACGFALAAAGFAVLTRIGGAQGPAVVVTGYIILSLGLAPVFTMATDLIVGTAPPERAGMASGLSETSAEFGGALGIALLGSLVTAVYRSLMASTVPTGVTPEAAAAARDTLGEAAAVAGSLPPQAGAALLEATRGAFTEAVVVTAAVSAALAIAAAIVTVTLLRRVGASDSVTLH
jgi:DHA2 family multidrug resistance protein-like MFS transporter